MSGDAAFVFGLIIAAAVAMASNRIRYDIVALLVVIALMLSGTLSVSQSLAGFGSSVVLLVAGLLVVGEMLARTGVARAVGDWILHKGGTSETRLLVLIMIGAAVLGAVMSSTAVVAIFIPIVLRIAAETNLNSSRMLLPMSYAALISGMLTLIATTPNIVVHEELKKRWLRRIQLLQFHSGRRRHSRRRHSLHSHRGSETAFEPGGRRSFGVRHPLDRGAVVGVPDDGELSSRQGRFSLTAGPRSASRTAA